MFWEASEMALSAGAGPGVCTQQGNLRSQTLGLIAVRGWCPSVHRLLQIGKVLWITPWHWLRFAQVFEAGGFFRPLGLYHWPTTRAGVALAGVALV